jgi:hypothetical protein
MAVQLAGWATPSARDWKNGQASEETMNRNARPLNEMAVQLAGSGPMPSGSPASTEKRGALNPAHSRWLMGYPSAWDLTAPAKLAPSASSEIRKQEAASAKLRGESGC